MGCTLRHTWRSPGVDLVRSFWEAKSCASNTDLGSGGGPPSPPPTAPPGGANNPDPDLTQWPAGETSGIPTGMRLPAPTINDILGLPTMADVNCNPICDDVGNPGRDAADIQFANDMMPIGCSATIVNMLVTGYDNSYRSTGKNPGDPGYGRTSSSTVAGNGTIAAPPQYPYGTPMYVPGYGLGYVWDRGGAIQGSHIDVWFPTTQQAINWGAQHLGVTTCK